MQQEFNRLMNEQQAEYFNKLKQAHGGTTRATRGAAAQAKEMMKELSKGAMYRFQQPEEQKK